MLRDVTEAGTVNDVMTGFSVSLIMEPLLLDDDDELDDDATSGTPDVIAN